MTEKFIPPTPNLVGDNVRCVIYNPSGDPGSWGHMHKDTIKKLQEDGIDIRIVDESWVPPAPTPPSSELLLQVQISSVLSTTDKYFTADALDNIDAPMQVKWREYRKALRNANKTGSTKDIPVDPKGNDPFKKFR
jgi:hypothetical protein